MPDATRAGALAGGWHALAPSERAMVTGSVCGFVAGIFAFAMTGRLPPFLAWFALVDAGVFAADLKLQTANAGWHLRISEARIGPIKRLPFHLLIGLSGLVWITLFATLIWYFVSERKIGLIMSPTQQEFVQTVEDFRKRYKAPESNGGALFKERDLELCKLTKAREPMAWTGVARLGRRGFKVEVERDVFLKVSRSKDHSPVDTDYASYKDGDHVLVIGWINGGRKACVSELSLTNAGSLMDPDFDFVLAKIQRL